MSRVNYKGKTAIITGASSGIGRATAIAFAQRGANIVLVSRNKEKLDRVEQEIKAYNVETLVVSADITKEDDVANAISNAIERFHNIDIMVCNAGVYHRSRAVDLSLVDVRCVMETNFYGSLYGIYGILPYFLKKGSGHIVAVSSVDGKKGLPLDSAYVASKFALTGFMDVLRQELSGTGIHVCTVLPARIDTPMIADIDVPKISAKVSPNAVAKAIVSAVQKRKREVVVPLIGAKFLIISNSISSALGDWIVKFLKLEGKGTAV